MKRTPLKRKTALKRGKGLRRRSKKREQAAKQTSARIGAWLETQANCCAHCGETNWLEVHHIDRKSHLPIEKRDYECNLLRLCNKCHSTVFASAPHSYQLALKLIADPMSFDLKLWHSLKPRPETYVTMADIVRHLVIVDFPI